MILDGEAHKEYLSTEQYGIGFKKGNEELKNTVEATLMEMAEAVSYTHLDVYKRQVYRLTGDRLKKLAQ